MPDVDDRCLSGSVQVSLAVSGSDPATFTPYGYGIVFLEVTRKER